MSSEVFEVPPLSRSRIRAFTGVVREKLRIDGPYFPIVRVIEFVLPQFIDNFVLDILEEEEMTKEFGAGYHAMTFPDIPLMVVRNDIYERARLDYGRDRLTLAHEFGHLLLHGGQQFAKRVSRDNIPRYRQSEWQANAFAGELLISAKHINLCSCVDDVTALFKVSNQAAELQWEVFKKDGIIK